MNTSKLEAGRELDALVAERVMEWKLTDRGFYSVDGKPESYNTPANWKPSTAIAANTEMEQQVEKLGLIQKYYDALVDLADLPIRVYNSAIEIDIYADELRGAVADKGYLALWLFAHVSLEIKCRAALKAVGYEPPADQPKTVTSPSA